MIIESWNTQTLRDLVTINYGKSPAEILSSEGSYSVVGTGGIDRIGTDFLYDGDSIILGRKGTIDRVYFTTGKFWVIDTAYYLSEFIEAYPRWLFYFLQTIDLRQMNEATGVPSLSRDALYKIKVQTPSLKEQKQIAIVLSTIDLAIAQTEAIIAKQQRIKTGLMQDLLTKGIDENGNIRSEETHEFKDSPLGRIPVEWSVKKISEAGDVKLGRQTAPRYKLGINSCPYLRVINISEDRLDLRDIKSMDFTPGEFKKYCLQIGDVLLTEGDLVSAMNVGRSAVFREKTEEGYCFQNSLIRFRPPDEKTAEYFHFAFCHLRSIGYLANATMATTVFHLSAGRLKKLYLKLPNTEEEKIHISKILAQQDKNIDVELQKREKLLLVKTGLMQDLLTGKVRVTELLKDIDR